MKRLRLKMGRDLWRMKWRALAIVFTLASGIAIDSGMSSALASLFWTRDSVFDELRFADLEVRFVPDDADNLPDLSDLPGVARVERRLLFPGTVPDRHGRPMMAVLTLLETPTPFIDSFEFLEGRPFSPDEEDAVVIEQSLARSHGYHVGDAIAVQVGGQVYESHIVGIVVTPEYFVSSSNPDYFIPERGSLGVVFGNIRRSSEPLGFTLVNNLLVRFDPSADAAAVTRAVLARTRKLNLERVIPRQRHFSHQFIQTELQALGFFLPAMVCVLLTLSSVITFLNFNRMVAGERRGLGALRAVGYDRRTLILSYAETGLALGLIGSLVGIGGSFLFFRDVFARMCADAIGMPVVRTTFDPMAIARGLLFGPAVAAVSAAVPVALLLRRPTRDILREPRAAAYFSRHPREEPSRTGPRLPVGYRYALRGLMRQRTRSVATLGSMGLALGVAVGFRMSVGSIDETLATRYAHEPWRYAVDFLYPVFPEDVDGIARLPGVQGVQPYLRRYVALEKGGRREDATIVGMDLESSLVGLDLAAGRAPGAASDEEAVLSLELAKKLGARLGDAIQVRALEKVRPLRIVGLLSDAVLDVAVVPLPLARDICELPEKASGVYLQSAAATPEMVNALYASRIVGRVTEKNELVGQIRRLLGVMFVVLDIAAAVSIFVAAIFVLSSINLSVLENEGEFATLRAIGYGTRAMARIVLTEAFACAVGAAILSAPAAALVSAYLNHRIGLAWFRVDNFFFPAEAVRVLLPYLVLIPVAASPGLRYIMQLDISRAMRTRVAE
jgi:ABC-type lipoprotein release transport system permease subunit